MSANGYLRGILARERVDNGPYSPAPDVVRRIEPILQSWSSGYLLSCQPSGAFAKGTANKSGTDIDIFASLSSSTPATLKEIYNSLFHALRSAGYPPRRQNVSIGITVTGTDVDVVPGKRQDQYSSDHSLYRSKADTWTKTNVARHISLVSQSQRIDEIRVMKLWRDQRRLDFLSFCLELAVIEALHLQPVGELSDNVLRIFIYLRDNFLNARLVDPANTNNVVSEDVTVAERRLIKSAAEAALSATNWNQIVQGPTIGLWRSFSPGFMTTSNAAWRLHASRLHIPAPKAMQVSACGFNYYRRTFPSAIVPRVLT